MNNEHEPRTKTAAAGTAARATVNNTPGPWRLLDQKLRPQFKTRILEIRAADGVVVQWGGFDGVPRTKAVNKANAHLIAAAPDLLHALKEILEYWQLTGLADCEEGCHCLVQFVEDVIAKAEGK